MQRPNILILYTDQQRWDALGANGNRQIRTPHLDRLAEQGTCFGRCFVQNPVCMPSRVSFLSGQYPSTLRITHMGVPVPEDLLTLPRFFGRAGYHCANIGKLHFLPHANRDHRQPHPDYGFDHLEISDEPGCYEDAYRAWIRRTQPEQLPHLSVGLPPATATWYRTMGVADSVAHPPSQGGGRFDFRGPIAFPGDEQATHSAFVADRTIDYLAARARTSEPFCCIAGFYSPHAPWVSPQRFIDMYQADDLPAESIGPKGEADRQRRAAETGFDYGSPDHLRRAAQGYYAMVSEVDHHVGRIMQALAAAALLDNTVVVFTSDHGEWLGRNLRFGKGYPADDAVSRVPLVIRAPGMPARRRVDAMVEAVDVMPTLAELAGLQIAPSFQGRSLAPLLSGRTDQGRSSALLEHTGYRSLRLERAHYLLHTDGREMLFDLDRDPAEHTDVAADAAYATLRVEARHMLATRLIECERPLPRIWPY